MNIEPFMSGVPLVVDPWMLTSWWVNRPRLLADVIRLALISRLSETFDVTLSQFHRHWFQGSGIILLELGWVNHCSYCGICG